MRPGRPIPFSAEFDLELERLGYERYGLRIGDLVGPSFGDGYRRNRPHPALLEGPLWRDARANIKLPVGYQLAGGAEGLEVRIVEPFLEYGLTAIQQGRYLRVSRRLVVTDRNIEPDRWSQFHGAVQRIKEAEARLLELGSTSR
jgi:hypothetical protein